MIQIDGAAGEGGGQVLRTALALSLLTGQPFEIHNIRGRRQRPGLMAQHLKCVEAAMLVGHAQAKGDKIGSMHLLFQPGAVTAGEFHIDIGTAGATSLVLQTVYLPLAQQPQPSMLTITGGTHVEWSPTFHFLSLHWAKFMADLGLPIRLHLERAGFYPQGDGVMRAEIRPAGKLQSLHLIQRGRLKGISGISAVANLDLTIAERQRAQALKRLERSGLDALIAIEKMPSRFKGTMLLLLAEFEHSQACFTALGAIGKRAEKVADEAVDELLTFLQSTACVDRYLADQLMLPLSLIPGVATYSTSIVTNHQLTNAEVVKQFLNVDIQIEGEIGAPGLVKIVGKALN